MIERMEGRRLSFASGGTTALLALTLFVVGCGGGSKAPSENPTPATLDKVVDIGGGRTLHVHCEGAGSPTAIFEAGDADWSRYYGSVLPKVSRETRACSYDRANLGASGPAAGPRQLKDLVGDLAALLDTARIPGPYVLVASSGGGYIAAGFAEARPSDVAGLIFFDTGAPYPNPPAELIAETAWNNPDNVEHRDYLQVEKDAWNARRQIGDIPVTIVTVDYGDRAEHDAERTNVADQKGWLVLSPRAEQVVVQTGHAIVGEDPVLATDLILKVIRAAR